MNLVKELQKPFGKAMKDKIVGYIGKDPTRFKELMEAFLTDNYRINQRAAWPLSYSVMKHPELIKPYLRRIVRNLKKPLIHDAVKRNTVRLLQFIKIPKKEQGLVIEACFDLLQNVEEPVAIRVFSMTVLANLCEEHPELAGEVRAVVESQMPYGSAGFVSRGRKVVKKLEMLERTVKY